MKEKFWIENKEYICHLNYEAPDLIDSFIDNLDFNDCNSTKNVLSVVYEYISIYLFICNMYHEDFKMKCIRDFFCLDYPEGEETFRKCESILSPTEKWEFSDDELEDYFDFCAKVIHDNIRSVLNDNPDDRHWSAVSVNGTIKSYISIKKQFSTKYNILDVENYFYENCFSKSDYAEFERLRREESAYYIGKQIK